MCQKKSDVEGALRCIANSSAMLSSAMRLLPVTRKRKAGRNQ